MGLEQWKGRAIAGTPESLRSEAVTGMPSAGRAGHLRVRDGFDQDRSPVYYLVAGAPLLVRPESWLPESLPAPAGRFTIFVLRRHARSVALVCYAPPLW